MTTSKVALVTQVLSISCSSDGLRVKVTRIARGKHAPVLELDARTLKEVSPAEAKWLPVASVETGLKTRSGVWTVGEFAAGLFVHTAKGALRKAPAPFNDPTLTVTAFAISDDERLALVGNSSGFVSVFDTTSGEERFGQRLHRGHVTAGGFAPGGARAFSGSSSGELCAFTLG